MRTGRRCAFGGGRENLGRAVVHPHALTGQCAGEKNPGGVWQRGDAVAVRADPLDGDLKVIGYDGRRPAFNSDASIAFNAVAIGRYRDIGRLTKRRNSRCP